MALLTVDDLQPGDILLDWFDTGAFGAEPVYRLVVKVGKKMVYVRDERGYEAWRYPHIYHRKVDPREVEDWLRFPEPAQTGEKR